MNVPRKNSDHSPSQPPEVNPQRSLDSKGRSKKNSGFISSRMGKGPRRMGTVIQQLIVRRGYASGLQDHALTSLVHKAAGSLLAKSIRVGHLRNGVLLIKVNDSTTLQEVEFQKRRILKALEKEHPGKIKELRFRIEAFESAD